MKKFAAVLFFVLLFQVCAGRATAQVVHLANSTNANLLLPVPMGYDSLELARLEFIYEQTDVDTVLSQSRDEYYILSVGDVYSYYEDYAGYRLDSACNVVNWIVTYAQGDSLSALYPSNGQRPEVLHNMRTGLYTVNEYNVFDFYQYKDSTARFAWTLLPDTTTVCGYACRKAEATFRGIRWTAWYAPSIPIPAGPWKLNGLPGLVLWAYDDKGAHDMKLTAARKAHEKTICERVKGYFRMKRERVNALLERSRTAPTTYKSLSGLTVTRTDAHGNPLPAPAKRKFHVPYELE